MGKNLLFHGSDQIVRIPELRSGKYSKDFGRGFYCTEIREQAIRWAKRKKTPIVNSYILLATDELRRLDFKGMTSEWLNFIAMCRNADPSVTIHDYDLVVGPMADDQVYDFVQMFLNKEISEKQFAALSDFHYPTHQICFSSQKALDYLEFWKYQDV